MRFAIIVEGYTVLSSQPRDRRGQVFQQPWTAAEVTRRRIRSGSGIPSSIAWAGRWYLAQDGFE